jgi:prephenate dehydrogenase
MVHSGSPECPHDVIAIIGVGLIGGSIAAAVKRRHIARTVVGIGRNESRLRAARDAGLIDSFSTTLEPVRDARLVIVCTPVDRIATDVLAAAELLQAGGEITDAGSIKVLICRDVESAGLPEGIRFVGAHPLAGSHESGWEHADAELFQDRVCVVTPLTADETSGTSIPQFWEQLGMRMVVMSPEAHDRAVAATSHVPHVVAAGLASLLEQGQFPLAATGFLDTTRIAAGDPDLWTAILVNNARPVSEQLARLLERLDELRGALDRADVQMIRNFLDTARANRNALNDNRGTE